MGIKEYETLSLPEALQIALGSLMSRPQGNGNVLVVSGENGKQKKRKKNENKRIVASLCSFCFCRNKKKIPVPAKGVSFRVIKLKMGRQVVQRGGRKKWVVIVGC